MAKKKKKATKQGVKHMETSKKILLFSGICFAITVLFSMAIFSLSVIQDKMTDFTVIITLITVVGGVFGTSAAFYYNKAKAENAQKIRSSYLKIKYLILDNIQLLDKERIQAEIEAELSKIDCSLDEEELLANQDITYNG